MTEILSGRSAFGHPGLPPNWTEGAKDGVGTAYNSVSRIWFTIAAGIITEIYYPTVDRPQVRDLQLLLTDGETFFHGERSQLFTEIKTLSPHSLGYRVTNSDFDGRYSIDKEIIADPSTACILQKTRLSGAPELLGRLNIYVQCAPHLGVSGWGNNGHVVESAGRTLLAAEKDGLWLILGATVPFRKLSCGYSGVSDGWTDIKENLEMDWEFTEAPDGNIALTGELDWTEAQEFTIGLALGDSLQNAITNLFHALAVPFESRCQQYEAEWENRGRTVMPLESHSSDGGDLYRASASLLAAHEDKTYPGAFIASLYIPWGETRGDSELGGYHLVWTRDMVNSVSGLLAAGDTEAARRALIYLAAAQQPDGGFPQNFWLDGRPYWQGIQLDQVAFPVILAWKLQRLGVDSNFDDYEMVMRAAAYLVRHGPATGQDRWEEVSGYSPSTLAVNIAALICATSYARRRGDEATAAFLEDYADFLECHLEIWTVTDQGTLLEDLPRHYVRINPVSTSDSTPEEDLDGGIVTLHNCPPGSPTDFPARDIVDAGFLELVRYGIRRPADPLIESSLKVVDSVLRVETPFGPVWRRYNHDGYGQRAAGEAYQGWGIGRAWPLLTGERAHYELAAGRDITPYIKALEGFSSYTGLLPEQVWDEADNPEAGMFLGRPTGAAMPLMWAHAEYIKLLRSVADDSIFDLIPEVAERYIGPAAVKRQLEIWKPNRQARRIAAGNRLRVQASASFKLTWTSDEWQTVQTAEAAGTRLGIFYVDLIALEGQKVPFRFTFYWTSDDRWEGIDYEVAVV
ncbi:glycoside hydrolase family 15 protein [Dehalogenimonas sp. THU2]|uniref:glycoside hydrolase family 15 protein n=1 Tax=Dehalogenimonas sp. THU2 TaxID=3151121 RepID=UPI003218A16D